MQRFQPPALTRVAAATLALAASFAHAPVRGADIDIYGGSSVGTTPNVVFLLDNTSNWSAANQAWDAQSSYQLCKSTNPTIEATCRSVIDGVYYSAAADANKNRPWVSNQKVDNVTLKQGQVQLRAMKLVFNSLVCSGKSDALKVNVGLSMMGDSGSFLSTGHSTGYMYFAVQELTGTAATANSTCQALITALDTIDAKIENPEYKAPSSANYGAAYYEIFKYFGGHTNPTLANNPNPNGATPIGRSGYGPTRYSNLNTLDDPKAFTTVERTTYKSPITSSNACGGNYVVLVGNGYPNAEPNNGGPTIFSGFSYTPAALPATTSDANRYADEWSYFLANTDVSPEEGAQKVFTYALNTYKDKVDPDQTKLLKSMASVGGIGSSAYMEVGGDLVGMVEAFRKIIINIAAVNSVFTAATLPVSTTTQGTYLNQIFVGMFRPDAKGRPRWLGNLKQYELGYVNGTIDLVDTAGASAVLPSSGFFSPLAKSYWTRDSVFFNNLPSGTPASASDSPDGAIVEKGGVAQKLRESTLANRAIFTAPSAGSALSTAPLSGITAFTADEIAWVRGTSNVTEGYGVEDFEGSYKDSAGKTITYANGPRHSLHGDVLHSRPVALNYGNGDVVVYYGSNDGVFRAVSGNKTGAGAGEELWAFIAPEHYDLVKNQRNPSKLLLLPQTDAQGNTVTSTDRVPKEYGMDGPIGVYARYNSAGSGVTEAYLYATMRRGGRSVYAFDVTSKNTPKMLWKINGGSGDFANLAQTWSMPKPVTFASTSATPPVVLFMGGGYDPAEDANGSNSIGNAVFIVNGRDGTLIKEIKTKYSVPSDVTVVDVNGDGTPDRAYVADVRGNLYRIDIPTTGDVSSPASWADTQATLIAELEGKVFYAPDVVPTKSFVSVHVGTGDREKPLLGTTADHFFLIKDAVGASSGAVTKDDLALVADVSESSMVPVVNTEAVNTAKGCYIKLATNGEKVVNGAFTIAGTTYFGTNRPKPANSTSCGDLGEAYAYKFPLFCGVPTSTRLIGGGLPPPPVGGIVEMTVNGQTKKVPFIIGGGAGGSPFKPEDPTPPISPKRTRLNWHIKNQNR